MDKVTLIKNKAIEYGFSKDLIDSINVEFVNYEDFNFNEKLGRYLPFTKTIELYDTDIDAIFPTYVHEIVHALQNLELEKRYSKIVGCLLYWLALTFLRPKMEEDAREIEDRIYAHQEYEASQPVMRG